MKSGQQKPNSNRIEHAFQPLWNLNSRTLFGFEALLRFPERPDENIESVFERAREGGTLFQLDARSIAKSFKSFPHSYFSEDILLFVNLYPSTLLHPQFPAFLNKLWEEHSELRGKIVWELSEAIQESALWNTQEMKERVQLLKELGWFIALDDIGKGVSEIPKIIELQPDYIKLDRYFSQGLAESEAKQRFISLLSSYVSDNTVLILEGIEKEEDLKQARKLNVPVVQGYLLGKPQKLTGTGIPSGVLTGQMLLSAR